MMLFKEWALRAAFFAFALASLHASFTPGAVRRAELEANLMTGAAGAAFTVAALQ